MWFSAELQFLVDAQLLQVSTQYLVNEFGFELDNIQIFVDSVQLEYPYDIFQQFSADIIDLGQSMIYAEYLGKELLDSGLI